MRVGTEVVLTFLSLEEDSLFQNFTAMKFTSDLFVISCHSRCEVYIRVGSNLGSVQD